MPTKPSGRSLDASSIDVLNAIRNSSSENYRSAVPFADSENIRDIGNILTGNPTLANSFLTNLVNRIGRVIISSRMYDNPWSMFKKGMLDYGETIEDIFVDIARPFEFDQAVSEKEVFKREISDVESVFHILNYKKFYKVTISEQDLNLAFLNASGVTDLINKIIDSLYAGARYDEFITMKYLIARHLIDGNLCTVEVPEVSEENAKKITTKIKEVSNAFTFMSTKYNLAGVHNYSDKDRQYLIVNNEFDAIMDVEVLASAFNMDKAQFTGKRVLVDGFGIVDKERLNELFSESKGYTELTDGEIKALNAIPAILVDQDWLMIFDNMDKFTELYNGQGLYWNYWYHCWKTFSISPFHNSVAFIPAVPTVTNVTVSPTTVTAKPGTTVILTPTVTTTSFASKKVTWSVDRELATVSFDGRVHILESASTGESITVTCTSVFDPSKNTTATITVE